jgi:hypothetical protein
MSAPIRNRIKAHRRVPAADLVPHEFNFRLHPDQQKDALAALYQEIGFARSLLAFELPDGRLKLIDGHLRRDLHPDMEVDVEVLDVNEEEARALLLSIDPLAGLAEMQAQIHEHLLNSTPNENPDLAAFWQAIADAAQTAAGPDQDKPLLAQYLILVQCRDEKHQVDLLGRFQSDGLDCKPLIS